jgi:hypothetical protein
MYQLFQNLDSTTQKTRSRAVRRGRAWRAFHTASCCRSATVLQRQLAVCANRGAQCPKKDPKPTDHDRSIANQPAKSQDNRDG